MVDAIRIEFSFLLGQNLIVQDTGPLGVGGGGQTLAKRANFEI